MPQSKKPKLVHGGDADTANAASIPSDQLANIFGYLSPVQILLLRRVCKKWNEAAKNTIVLESIYVGHERSYNIMKTMSTALPNLQHLELGSLWGKYVDGEDPDEKEARESAHRISYDIDMVSNFKHLRVLELKDTPLNGSYPCLFNFSLLTKLTVSWCKHLKWDLGALAGFPLLREFRCECNHRLTGNIDNLRVIRGTLKRLIVVSCPQVEGNICSLTELKDTLQKLVFAHCPQIDGNFMDLADFPHLKVLDMRHMVSITGDIRGMGEHSFPKLKSLDLPKNVYGGNRYEIMRVADAKELIDTIFSIKKQHNRHPSLFEEFDWYLSENSPDWYHEPNIGYGSRPMGFPLSFCIVRAGSRLGWRWERQFDFIPDYRFEITWLDPLPATERSSEHQRYIQDLQEMESYMDRFPFFRGYSQPPSEAVFKRLQRMYEPSQEEIDIYENL